MKKILLLTLILPLLSACGPEVGNTLRGSLDINNFTRQDAIRVFTCAINKEEKTSERFALEAQLAVNKNLSDEAWQKLVDINKEGAFEGVNNVAKKYSCF